uniref:Putative defensin protein n=1 Tax=Ipomoea trifida TaxID=35884 RepID=Q6JJ46_IPOTF|nr:putative defensin protein [Ipomoea trifida]
MVLPMESPSIFHRKNYFPFIAGKIVLYIFSRDYPVFDFTSAQYGYGPKNIHQVFCVGDLIAPLQEEASGVCGREKILSERFKGRCFWDRMCETACLIEKYNSGKCVSSKCCCEFKPSKK